MKDKLKKSNQNIFSLSRVIKLVIIIIITFSFSLFQANNALAHRPHSDVYEVELSPNYSQDKTVFIMVRGNLFRSQDGGENWQRIWQGLDYLGQLSSLSVSSQNKQILFAASSFDGIYKSDDGGSSWEKVNNGLDNFKINLLEISPHDYNFVLAAGKEKGLYKTQDGGKNWQEVLIKAEKITAVSFAPNHENIILIGDGKGHIYLSLDRGQKWQQLFTFKNSGSVTTIAVSPHNNSDNTFFVGTEKEGIFRTIDGGKSFQTINQGITDRSIQDLVIIPNTQGESTLLASSWQKGIFKSTDNGNSWQKYDGGLIRDKQADLPQFNLPHFSDLRVSNDFNNDQTIFLAGFKGLFKSTNGGKNWQEMESLSARMIVGLAISPNYKNDSTIAVVNYVGEAYISEDAGVNWTAFFRGLEIPRFTQNFETPYDDPRRYFDIAFSPNYASDQTIFLGFLRDYLAKSTDKGKTWKIINLPKTGNFIRGTILAVSPDFASDRTIYIASNEGDIYYSQDGGDSFAILSHLKSRIFSLIISPHFNSDRTLFASGIDGVYKSENAGKTWQVMTNNSILAQRICSELAISNNYPQDQTVFVGTDRGLFVSKDSGKTWQKLEGGVIEEIALSPNYSEDRTFVITVRGEGQSKTTNDGLTFTKLNSGPIFLARMHHVPSASGSIQFSPAYKLDRTLYGFGSPNAEVFKSNDEGNNWQSLMIPPTYVYERYSLATYINLFLMVYGKTVRIFFGAALAALIMYIILSKSGLEKTLHLSKLQLKMVATITTFIFVFMVLKAVL
jgi:photosystem II stability/assembly factor-like uncharacterized protein